MKPLSTANHSTGPTKRAIIFVHGLAGSEASWNDKSKDFLFAQRFLENSAVRDNFSLYIFDYETSILGIGDRIKKFLSLIPSVGSKQKELSDKFNVGIRKIALRLSSEIQNSLSEYDQICLITHSMGGLVSKRAMVELGDDVEKIALYISLSVPHSGSNLASLGSKLTGNPQIKNLRGFSDFTSELSKSFSNLKHKPKCIYQSGDQDKIVPEGSAIPEGISSANCLYTSDDHFSVLSIHKTDSNQTYSRILKELSEIVSFNSGNIVVDAPINLTIPTPCSFKQAAIILVNSAESTIEFNGFSEKELNTPLPPQSITRKNTMEAIKALALLANNEIGPFQIEKDDHHFKLNKIL